VPPPTAPSAPQVLPDQPDRLDAVLDGLTAPQKRAASHTEGPLLVLAGPGSGKTRVITRRIAYLIACGIPAWQILAVTFTNKAAAEMRERVHHLLGEGPVSRGLTVTTFHALCARLLRRYADVAKIPGLTGTFAIADSDDQSATVKKAIDALNLSTSNWPPRSVLGRISSAKNELLDPDAFAAQAHDFNDRTLAKIYQAYQRTLRAANSVDFDDLLLLTAKLLRENDAVRRECRARWQYLLVDEYQDTNRAQFAISTLLAAGTDADRAGAAARPNICAVGDPDQSIYGWRGADISNILQFEAQFPGCTTIALGENFRSTKHIIAAADTLIRNNQKRKHKDLFTANAQGDKIDVILCRDEHHEADLVVDWLRARKEDAGSTWKDMAVFYRTNALSRVVEDRLRAQAIPYVIARGTAFYQREEVKHALAYLRVVANPRDDVSLERIVNTPSRGIGDTSLDRIKAHAVANASTLMDALRAAGALGLSTRAASSIAKFVKTVDAWTALRDQTAEPTLHDQPPDDTHPSLAALVERVLRESGLEDMYKAGRTDTDEERLANLAELVSSAREFEENYDPASDPAALTPAELQGRELAEPPTVLELLRAYLERVTLVADADAVDPASGAVTLMTLHAAKGLEFHHVAMVGLEEGLLPHSRVNENPAELEEERRLCFVGITRAMRRLLMTSARYRTVRGMNERTIPSRFLDELPAQHTAVSDQGDYHEPGWDDDAAPRRNDGDAAERFAARRSSGSSAPAPARDSKGNALRTGDRVRHAQFGLGEVLSVTGGADARAQVRFREAGLKTLVLQYARLEKIV
jgi:DNA helicase II / ATP-dependent DNA helicase PcrA